jgi:hypothetical protein
LIKQHISLFYEAADTEDHENWASLFAQDGTLKKGVVKSISMAGLQPHLLSYRINKLMNYQIKILAARKNSWRDGQTKEHIVYKVFPHRNVCSSQPYISHEQRRLCSGSAQARLIFGSGLVKSVHPYYATGPSQD